MGSVSTRAELLNGYALQRIEQLLHGVERIVMLCHARPDGDCIGAMLGLAQILVGKGHRVHCISPSGVPRAISWPAGHELLVEYEENREYVKELVTASELVIALDFNALSRMDDELADLLRGNSSPRVMLDHHPNPTDEFDLYFSFPAASSTCEVVYEVATALWGSEVVTPGVAECLYMGLMTDTGSFSYSCGRKRTFEVAGALVEAGADVPAIRSHVYGSYSEGRVRLYGFALYEQMRLVSGGRAAVMALSRRLLSKYDYEPGDTEGLVNEPLAIGGVVVSVMLTERNAKTVRVSLRSRMGVQINGLAVRYFNGGGHPQASGGMLRMDLEGAMRYTVRVLEEFFSGQ